MPRRLPDLVRAAMLALLLGSCASEPERPASAPAEAGGAEVDSAAAAPTPPANPFAEPARRALRIELGLDDYQTVTGTWAAGEATSAFTAYFAGDTLRFVEERVSLGDYGEETNVYYFADDALFYTVQNAVHVRPGQTGAARRDTVQLRVALTASGSVLASEGTVGGEAQPVEDGIVEGVRSRAAALQRQAQEHRRAANGVAA